MAKKPLGYQSYRRSSRQTDTMKNKLWNPQNRKRRYDFVVQEKQQRSHVYGKKIRNNTAPVTASTPCKKENHHNSTYSPIKNVGERDLSSFEISGVLSAMQNGNSPSLFSSDNTHDCPAPIKKYPSPFEEDST
jgi:hypothetical protein